MHPAFTYPVPNVKKPLPIGGSEELQKIALTLRGNLQNISAGAVPSSDLDKMAFLIHDSMTAPSRYFHSPDHVFDISEGLNSIQILAALFHDIIYYSIDGGLSDAQHEILSDVIVEDKIDGSVRVNDVDGFRPNDSVILMVLNVFGFQPGQILNPFMGQNEFLSAAIAARCLEKFISKTDILRIVACIEATIPFRGTENSITSGDALFKKLQHTNAAFHVGMEETELTGAMHLAIELGNRDVENFSFSAPDFLDNSWALLPESNISLRDGDGGALKVSEFAFAINKMRLFFGFLQPEVVFHQFKGIPNDVEHTEMSKRAGENIDIGKKYMGCKFLCASFLVAMAVLTGGDSPMSTWVFDYDSHLIADEEEDWVELMMRDSVEVDKRVSSLLTNSVGCEMYKFNIRNTPTATLLYSLLGDEGVANACEYATTIPMGEEEARAFMDVLPRQAVHYILSSFCKLATSNRKEALTKLAAEYLD